MLGQVNKPKEIFSDCKKVVKFIFIEIENAENHDRDALYTLNAWFESLTTYYNARKNYKNYGKILLL